MSLSLVDVRSLIQHSHVETCQLMRETTYLWLYTGIRLYFSVKAEKI